MGTEGGYNMSRCDYIKTGGVGCKACWRWMQFNNYNSHQKGKRHKKNVVKRIAQNPVLWEIMFPKDFGRQPMLFDDQDMQLESLIQQQTAASDSQPTCTSDPAGDLEPTDEDRAAWAASGAAAEEEWAMGQGGPVEGRMGEYGGPGIDWMMEWQNMVDEVEKTG